MLNHNLVNRGTFFRCLNFGRALVQRGYEVTLITTSDRVRMRPTVSLNDGVTVLETPRFGRPGEHDGGWAPVDISYRICHLLRHRYDIVHAFDHRPNVSFPWFVSKAFKHALYLADWADWWCRGGILTDKRPFGFLDRCEANLEEGVKKSADAVTVTSKVLFQRALSLGIDEQRLLYLPSGADTERIRPMNQAECRQALDIPLDAKVVDFVGHSLWDLNFLLETLQRVSTEVPKLMVLLIGSEWKEGRQVSTYRERGLNVRGVGQVPLDQLSKYLGAADVHALPLKDTTANWARGPIKLGDYMASGRPTVTQAIGEAGDIVAGEGIGLVSGPSEAEFAHALSELLEAPARCVQLGKLAREVAEQKYTWEQCSQPLADFYERLLR